MQGWSGRRVTILAARGLGDGLLSAALGRAAQRAGAVVRVWSTPLVALSDYLPNLPVQALPPESERAALLSQEDFVYVGTADLAQGTQAAKSRWIFTKGSVDRGAPFLSATASALAKAVGYPAPAAGSPLHLPAEVKPGLQVRRVVLHGESSTVAKCWGAPRLAALARRLLAAGWQPVLLVPPDRLAGWTEQVRGELDIVSFGALGDVAAYLAESAAAVTMDSGIGHLASAVGCPVVAIFRRASSARFWQPAWGRTATVSPRLGVPRALGPALWRTLIGARRVERTLYALLERSTPSTRAQRSA